MAWSTYCCKINDKDAQVLIDDRFHGLAPIKELPFITWVGIYCLLPYGSSFNNPQETKMLDEIEDRLIQLFNEYGHGWVVYTHRIGTAGIREYYFYHGEKADLKSAFNILLSLYALYKLEIETINDAVWNEYSKYLIR